MSYNVETTEHFDKEVKRLAKKYKSLKADLAIFFEEMSNDPKQCISLGNNIYKIRDQLHWKREKIRS